MEKNSSDSDFAKEIFLFEVLDGNEEGNSHQLDAKFAEQLHFQEAIYESIRSLHPTRPEISRGTSHHKPEKSVIKTKSGESSESYCRICFTRKDRHGMFPIPGCNHGFCSKCISKHVETRLKENVTIIMCPGENCKVLLELEPCRHLLPNQVINLWQDLLCEETLCATGGRLYCPFKECSALLLDENRQEVITECECPYCHKLFCAQCRVPWHYGIGCEEYQKLGEDERGREDILVRNLAKEKKWRRCPHCHIIVERTEGCPHMTCRCKFEFCYACGEEWAKDHNGCQGN